jgi:hypothetical protein
MAVSLDFLNFILPILSFLFVFVIVYALLAKTKILGENFGIHIFISFILATFFIVNLSLVEFVEFSFAWLVVFFVVIFFILALIGFTHGKIDVIMKPWVAWALLAVVIIIFIVSSSYVFAWTINWEKLWDWAFTDWFGLVLLLIVAGIVSWVLSQK